MVRIWIYIYIYIYMYVYIYTSFQIWSKYRDTARWLNAVYPIKMLKFFLSFHLIRVIDSPTDIAGIEEVGQWKYNKTSNRKSSSRALNMSCSFDQSAHSTESRCVDMRSVLEIHWIIISWLISSRHRELWGWMSIVTLIVWINTFLILCLF